MSLAFVLDEQLRGPLWQAILRHNLRADVPLDVIRVGETANLPLGADDRRVLAVAEEQSRLLLTEDRHTMSTNLRAHLSAGHKSPGVLILRRDVRMNELIEFLVLISEIGDAAEFANATTYIP